MNSERIESLKKVLESDPGDTFARYAIGLEYLSVNGLDDAKNIFNEIIAMDPNYVAVYYQLGKTYELMGDENSAKKIYEKGIYVAASQSDEHTKNELEQALNDLI